MLNLEEKILDWLFKTKALKVCTGGNPFWYTSCTIGPYYINTHFLYGSEKMASKLLELIDEIRKDKIGFSDIMMSLIKRNYEENGIYHELMDNICEFIKRNINILEIDYISGGERRDWFFSLMVAYLLKKPHIAIFKDMSFVIYENSKSYIVNNIKGAKVLHIADIVTEASSFFRTWIPAVEKIKGEILWSLTILDRMQGGSENLKEWGVTPYALMNIDLKLFKKANEKGLIGNEEYNMIKEYMENPFESMRNFLINNNDFLQKALNSDDKTAERAKTCLDMDIYKLKDDLRRQ